ncbi:winged helix DNA-binding protein [Acidaminobacter sp. JC074]|uniref:MarR family winged helix-turn-helix transcriptional regulator n=1 Tax=Acidaminobacter sp. JC074 TaxID=2530199 RepID=UPI001F0FBE63|nr:MarR family transcriptional regulator [Acidaminobacter sp. JC074]MCH4889234.1 winged helix DNA-binding protein [Acidaminobacter sp. JC074]
MEARCLIGVFRQISKELDKQLKRRINQEDLPVLVSHISLFYILPSNGDHIAFNQLTDRWEISKSSLSDILKRYEEIGVIYRIGCPYDKRVVNFGMTDKGMAIRDKLNQIEDELLINLMVDLNQKERRTLESMLKRIS